MLLKDIEPFTRQVVISTLSSNVKNDVYKELRASDCRLFYILNGNGTMKIENKDYPLHHGCAILVKSGAKYVWQLDEKGVTAIFVNFDFTMNFSSITASFHPVHSEHFSDSDILEHIDFEDAKALNSPIYIKNATSIEANLRLLASEYYLKSSYAQEYLSSCLKFIIISLAKLAELTETDEKKKNYETVRKVIQYIENNYHLEMTNEMIGDYFHFNPSYLNRIFKENTGDTLHNFLVRYRINLAMDLLHTTNLPINEVASIVGFSDIPHFIKSFKKSTGKTPGEYRLEDKK